MAQTRPGFAAIDGFEDAAALAAADQFVGAANGLPEGGIEDARVVGVYRQVAGPGPLATEQHALPRLAAILRTIDAAFRVRPVRVSLRGHVNKIGIMGMDAHLRDMPRIRQAEMRPRLPLIGRF